MRSAVFVLSLACLLPTHLAAADSGPVLPPWKYGFFVGSGRHSPVTQNWGGVPDRDHYLIGLHAAAKVAQWHGWDLSYAPNVKAVIVAAAPANAKKFTAIGLGLAPLGLETGWRWSHLEAYGQLVAGLAAFNKDVPIAGAGRTAFTLETGAGLGWHTRRFTVRTGYEFMHASNNQTKDENPGLDGHIIYIEFRP